MQTVTRHGGGSHFVRPDRVYRTGVLSSTMGYDPTADVESVAASFTQYPADLSLPDASTDLSLPDASGLSGLSGGVFGRMKTKFKRWQAQRQLRGLRGLRDAVPNVAIAPVGQAVAPSMVSKEAMLAYLMQGSLPANYAQAQAQASYHGWANPYWPR